MECQNYSYNLKNRQYSSIYFFILFLSHTTKKISLHNTPGPYFSILRHTNYHFFQQRKGSFDDNIDNHEFLRQSLLVWVSYVAGLTFATCNGSVLQSKPCTMHSNSCRDKQYFPPPRAAGFSMGFLVTGDFSSNLFSDVVFVGCWWLFCSCKWYLLVAVATVVLLVRWHA